MVLLGAVLGVLAVCQILSLFYAEHLVRNGALDVDRRFRSAASNTTLVVVLLMLLVWPSKWYREAPFAGTHRMLAKKMKASGAGSSTTYEMVYRVVPAVVLSLLAGVAAGAMTGVFQNRLSNVRPHFRQPSGPFQNSR